MRSHRGIAVRLCRSAVSSREPCRDGCFLAAKQAQHLSMLPTNRGAWSVADSLACGSWALHPAKMWTHDHLNVLPRFCSCPPATGAGAGRTELARGAAGGSRGSRKSGASGRASGEAARW